MLHNGVGPGNCNMLVMTQVGLSLESVLNSNGGTFPLKTVSLIAYQLVSAITIFVDLKHALIYVFL